MVKVSSLHLEFYLRWCWAVLTLHGKPLSMTEDSMALRESCRALLRALSVHDKDLLRLSDESQYLLSFIETQMQLVDGEGDGSSS